jgi:putative ABC transport system permease protein
MMPNLAADLRYAVRTLRASPSFTLVALLSLTLGIGANTTIFSIANGLLLSELPVPHPEQLVRIVQGGHSPLGYPELRYVRDHSTTIASVIGERLTSGSITTEDGKVDRFDGALVTGDYFAGLGLRPALGQFFVQHDDVQPGTGPTVVLSYDYWQTRFGGETSVVGRRVRLNQATFTIVGVAPKGFASSTLGWRPSAWIGLGDYQAFSGQPLSEWGGSIYTTARLKPGADAGRAASELDALASQLRSSDSAQFGRLNFRVLPARGMNEEARQILAVILGAMLALVSIVLLIACANVGNLLLARATSRRREIAVRIALGATRRELVQQLLTESFVLALAGGALGLASSFVFTRLVTGLLPTDVPVGFDFSPDHRVLLFSLALSVITALAFGLAPALRASRTDLVGPLKDDVAMQGVRRSRLRSTLLVAQVAFGLMLITAASLFVQSLSRARSMDPGFQAQGVVNLKVDLGPRHYDSDTWRATFDRLLAEARALPGVRFATLSTIILLEGSNKETTAQIVGAETDQQHAPHVSFEEVSSQYFETLSIPMVQGRPISEADIRSKAKVVVISNAMARHLWAGKSAIGQRIRVGGAATSPVYEIIGVARDVKYYMIGDVARDLIFLPFTASAQTDVTLQVRTDAPVAVIGRQLEQIAERLEPTLPPAKAKPMRDDISIAYLPSRIGATIFGTFGVLALIIAMLGIYGITSYIVAQRTRELGVRAALGAQRSALVGTGLRDTLRLVGIGLVIGIPLSYGVARALTALPILYDTSAGDPAVLGGATVLLVATALLASYIPARRAAAVDPVIAMRAS